MKLYLFLGVSCTIFETSKQEIMKAIRRFYRFLFCLDSIREIRELRKESYLNNKMALFNAELLELYPTLKQ
jgi:hypothetical protein